MNKLLSNFLLLLALGNLEINAQLIQHLDAGNAESVLKDSSDLIIGWNDLSGAGNNATASQGKVYYHNSNPEDGRAWINFGNEQNSLQLFGADSSDNWLDQSSGNGGFCVLLAFKITRIIGNWNDLIGNSSAVSAGFGLRYSDKGTIQAYLGGKTINKNGINLSAGDRVVYALNYNATTGSYEFWDSRNNSSVTGTIANMDFSLDAPVTLGATSGDARYFDGMVGEVQMFQNSLSQEEFFSECQKLLLKWVVEEDETEAPTPNPASFSVPPKAISGSLVRMTASTGSDLNEPVEYYFTEITGNPGATNSGWQTDSSYRDGDLQALTQYAYSVKMRDAYGNTGENSDTVYVETPETFQPGQENELEYGAYYGYQGWHFAKGDGRLEANDWVHWFESQTPDAASIHGDMWPDLREYNPENLYETLMLYPDGEVAKLYSCHDYSTIDLHVKWMKEYGIKGCAVQRFTDAIDKANKLEQGDKKVRDFMAACEKYGIKFWIMHDSGQGDENEYKRITSDWKHLVDDLDILQSPAYTWQNGLPVYGLWGLGVNSRQWSPSQASAILDFYQNGEESYRTYVCGGVPRTWRTNPNGWTAVFDRLDMISPWRTIFNNIDDHTPVMVADYNYCNQHGIDYNPVVSPGASTKHLRDSEDMRNWKPRDGGHFIWDQVYEVCKMGSKFLYVAMFDEVDEGTAMYKLVETVEGLPVGADQVPLKEDGYDLPSDWYLQVGTEIQKMLEGTIPLTEELPITPLRTNIPVQNSGNGLKVYPVPAQSRINIEGVDPGEKYQVYDRLGIMKMGGSLLNNNINISSLPQGFYIIHFEDGNQIFIKY